MLEHDLEYQTHSRYECHQCRAITSHKRKEIRSMKNKEGGESSIMLMECYLCKTEELIPATKFDNGNLTSLLVRR